MQVWDLTLAEAKGTLSGMRADGGLSSADARDAQALLERAESFYAEHDDDALGDHLVDAALVIMGCVG